MTRQEVESELRLMRSDPYGYFSDNGRVKLKRMRVICAPDKWPDDTEWATQAFAEVGKLYGMVEKPLFTFKGKSASYTAYRLLAIGDLRKIYDGRDEHGERVIIKVPRLVNRAVERLCRKEADTLAKLRYNAIDDFKIYGALLPALVEPVDTGASGLVNVMKWLPDGHKTGDLYTAKQLREIYPDGLDGRHIAWILRRLLMVLGYIHRQDVCHNAVTPEHVLINPKNHGIVLTGWIHSEIPGSAIRLIPADRKSWYPEDTGQNKRAAPGVDIHMAAKLAEFLGEKKIPEKLKLFMRSCQLGGGTPVQPQDAWQLDSRLGEQLRTVYGPPKFVDLAMPAA